MLGNYYLNVNSEALTIPIKSSNATSELCAVKGKKLLEFNEAEGKIQVKTMKILTGPCGKATIKMRGLYQDPTDIIINFTSLFFSLIFL